MLFLMVALWPHTPTKNVLEFLEFVHFIGCKSYFLKKTFSVSRERKRERENNRKNGKGRKTKRKAVERWERMK